MDTRKFMGWLGAAIVAGAVGCNADEEPAGLVNAGGGGASGGGHAGSAGAGGSSSTAGTAGNAGAGGGAGSAATGDAGPDQSVGSDARSDVAAETGSTSDVITDSSDAAAKSYALAVGADFSTGGVKLAAVDWSTKQIAGSTVFPNVGGDAIPVVSGGGAFVLERGKGALVILQKDKPWLASKTIDLGNPPDAASYSLNPVAVVSTGAKAYVPLFSTNRLAIVDVGNGTLTGQVDLSSLVDPADPDGLVDVFDGAYDPATQRAYFLLLGIGQFEQGIEPDRVSSCIAVAPSIIAVDTTNDQIVDLNGDAGGKGVALTGRNPTALVPDLARGRLLVVDAGCYESEGGNVADAGADAQAGAARMGRGIEAFGLAAGTSTWLYTHGERTRLSGLIVVDATHAFVSGDDENYATHRYSWDPSNGATHGAEVLTMPAFSPHSVGGNLIVGLSPNLVDGASREAFVTFAVGTGVATTVVPDVFGDGAYSAQYAGWAFLP